MIYQLVLSDDTQFAEFGKELSYASNRGDPNPQKLRQFRPEKRNNLMIQQPGLFQTCRTIRAEALLSFFQLRDFHFVVNGGIFTLKKLLRWIDSLNNTERSNIRSMTVLFLGGFHMGWVLFLNELVELLPPKVMIRLEAALDCNIQKFQRMKATWVLLKPKARVLKSERVHKADYTTNERRFSNRTRQVFESEGSIWPCATTLRFKNEV